MYELQEPSKRISKDAIKVWRITNTLVALIALIVFIGLLWASYQFEWYRWIVMILWISLIVTPIFAIWSIYIEPKLLQRYWRYGIDENYVRLRHGIFNRTDAVIPMTKIQYVEANQGPFLRKYNLYSLMVGTLSMSHEIPALPKEEAYALRDQISQHAKLKEVE